MVGVCGWEEYWLEWCWGCGLYDGGGCCVCCHPSAPCDVGVVEPEPFMA